MLHSHKINDKQHESIIPTLCIEHLRLDDLWTDSQRSHESWNYCRKKLTQNKKIKSSNSMSEIGVIWVLSEVIGYLWTVNEIVAVVDVSKNLALECLRMML